MTSEEMEKYRVLASESRARSGLRWLSDWDNVTWDEFRDFVFSFVLPGDEMRVFLEVADRYEANGKRPRDVRGLHNQLRIEMAKKFTSLDALSILGASVPPGDTGDSMPWTMIHPTYFLAPFAGDGGFLTITGRPRKGKTGVGCLYAEMWLAAHPGSQILTNVPLAHPVPYVREITGTADLLDGVADHLDRKLPWLWILDEGGLVWLRAEAMTRAARGLEKFARIVPKLGGSLIYIEQRVEGVPSVLTDFAQSHILCTSPGFVIADLPARRMGVRDVPRPHTVKYRSGEVGYFEADIDMDKLLAALPDRGPERQAERIRVHLKKVEAAKALPHAANQPRDPRNMRFKEKASGADAETASAKVPPSV